MTDEPQDLAPPPAEPEAFTPDNATPSDAQVTPPRYYAATDDPAHPLHHHAKPIAGPSPSASE